MDRNATFVAELLATLLLLGFIALLFGGAAAIAATIAAALGG